MFENIIDQNQVTNQLTASIKNNSLPPSILFSGPACAGKLTSALELARVVCCFETGSWKCNCASCLRHKELISADVLIIGARDHTPEILAAAKTMLSVKTAASRYLFLRSIRKLTSRFDSRLWDTNEQTFLKAAPIIAEIEELLTEFTPESVETEDAEKLNKKTETLLVKTSKLQDECMYDSIPVNQVRKASSWIRLMPSGKKKILIIENADKMQEGARNAFLKILEEPPLYSLFILTSARRGAIIPTILSRVRPYSFSERCFSSMEEIIKRVFRSNANISESFNRFNLLTSFFYGFLPVGLKTIQDAAAVFFGLIFLMLRRENKILPAALYAAIENYKQGNDIDALKCEVSHIIIMLNKCKPHTVYVLFLNCLLIFLETGLKTKNCSQKECEAYFKITALIRDSENSVGIFNISAQAALENLAVQIKEVLA